MYTAVAASIAKKPSSCPLYVLTHERKWNPAGNAVSHEDHALVNSCAKRPIAASATPVSIPPHADARPPMREYRPPMIAQPAPA